MKNIVQKQIYTKDKKVKITFRCDDVISSWLQDRANLIGLTPSAFVRHICYQSMYAEKLRFGVDRGEGGNHE